MALASLVMVALAAAYSPAYAQSADDPVVISLGVLVPDSGMEAAAIERSVSEINDMLEMVGAEWRLESVYPGENIGFAEFIARSQEDGITAFVGPGDAVSLMRAKEVIADAGHSAVYVGCCVQATHHSILGSGDNVFVMAPDVLGQAAAIAAVMEEAGIEHAIPVYSGDLESNQMRATIAVHFDGIMDPGVLVPPHAIDYSPVVSAIAGKAESIDGKAAVLVLEPGITDDLMVAGYPLADIAWFGSSSASGLPSLDSAAADFAERVGYVVPRFEHVHEHRFAVNLHYTTQAWSAYDAVQIIAHAMSNPTVSHVPNFGVGSLIPVLEPPAPDATTLAAALPLYAASYGGGIGNTQMDTNGGLEFATYMMYTMADGTWMKQTVYNPPTPTIISRVAGGEAGGNVYRYDHTHGLYDVHTIGALFPLSGSLGEPAEQRLSSARLAVITINERSEASGIDWFVSLHIEDTQTDPDVALEKLKKMDRLGIDMVVGPSASASAAAVREYANENDIILLSPSTSHALSIPGDTLYRVSPPSIHEVTVLAKMLERDGMEHAVVIHRQDLWGNTLVEGLLSEFGGTIHAENGYRPELANEGILDYERIATDVAEDVQALVEEHGESTVAVMMIGFGESAGILEAASSHPVLGSVQWYGSAGNANRLAILANDVAVAFAQSVNYMGPILMIDDSVVAQVQTGHIKTPHPGKHIDPYAYVTYDAVFLAGLAVGEVAGHPATEVGPILSTILGEVAFISGDGGLDENGDLADADYDIWQVQDGRWHNVLVYDSDREKFLREVIVGAPLPATGLQADSSIQRNFIYYLAILVANGELENQDADWRLTLEIEDTTGDPQRALQAVESMHQRGINLLLGPQGSASVDAVYQYVEENDMLIVSCCATGTGLAMPDRIFRLAPDDTRQADALNALLEERTTERLVIAYRDDAFGSSLKQAVVERFEGDIVEIPYDSELANRILLDRDSVAARIAGAVQDMSGKSGDSGTAVLLIGYGESAGIMASASEHPVLGLVKWYGTSGTANQPAITTDQKSAVFAEMVNYEATLLAEPPPNPSNLRFPPYLHTAPNIYTYTNFDAVTLLAAAVEVAGSDDAEAVAAVLPHVASQILGTSGSLALDTNGDLDRYDYDVWHIRDGAWEKAATYHPDEGLKQVGVDQDAAAPESVPEPVMIVQDAIAMYDSEGVAAFETINSMESEDLYPFVIDAETLTVVAEGAFPQVVGLPAIFLHDADRPLADVLDELEDSDGVWVEYIFHNPRTSSDEVKTSYLVLHDGHIFGSGNYTSPDAGATDVVNAMLRLYDTVGEGAFSDAVSVQTDGLNVPFVLDAGTLEIVAHANPNLSGGDIRDAISSGQSLEFVSDMLDRRGSLWLSYPSADPAPGAEYTRTYMVLRDGYVFASGYGVDVDSRLQSLVDESVRLYEREGDTAFDTITSMDMTRQTVYDLQESKLAAVTGSPQSMGVVVPISAVALDRSLEEFLQLYEQGGTWSERFSSAGRELRQSSWSVLHDDRYIFFASSAYSPEAAAVAEVNTAIDLYKTYGEAVFDSITWQAVDPAIVYPFVFDADTWRAVAHAAFPDRLDMLPASIMADHDLDELSEMLAESEGVWASYKFYNPITNLVEYKRTWLSLYDGYIFAAGYYFGNFDHTEGIIAGAIADYDKNGEAAFEVINSEMSGSLNLSPIVLDYDTLDVVAHGGYPGLAGQNIKDVFTNGDGLADEIRTSLVHDGDSLLVTSVTRDPQSGIPTPQSTIFQLHEGYIFAASQPLVVYTQ